jgi:hypothetical protein
MTRPPGNVSTAKGTSASRGIAVIPESSISGGEVGHAKSGRSTSADGKTIRDFDFLWLEMNEKKAFDLKHG